MGRAGRLRLNLYVVVGAATILLVGGTTLWRALASEEARQLRRFQTWWIDGPPCPTWTTPTATSPAPRRLFVMEGVRLLRQHGHMVCFQIRDHGGHGPGDILVCHLLSPGRVEVRGPSGLARFDPGAGGPAAILVDGAGARCVTRINAGLFADSAVRAYD